MSFMSDTIWMSRGLLSCGGCASDGVCRLRCSDFRLILISKTGEERRLLGRGASSGARCAVGFACNGHFALLVLVVQVMFCKAWLECSTLLLL